MDKATHSSQDMQIPGYRGNLVSAANSTFASDTEAARQDKSKRANARRLQDLLWDPADVEQESGLASLPSADGGCMLAEEASVHRVCMYSTVMSRALEGSDPKSQLKEANVFVPLDFLLTA